METLTGLVIRTTDYGENEKLLTVLTAEGKVTVCVHGGRGVKSRNLSVSSLLSYAEMTVSEKNGRFSLREGNLLDNFFGLRSDLNRFALASYFAQVADEVCVENSDESDMLSLLLNTLYLLGGGTFPPAQIKAVFELRCAACSGFAPALDVCSRCEKEESEWMYLDVMNGCLLCSDCFGGGGEELVREHEETGTSGILLPVEHNCLAAMRYVLGSPAKRIFSFRLEEEALASLGRITETYLLHQIGRSFDTLAFYKEVEKIGIIPYGSGKDDSDDVF